MSITTNTHDLPADLRELQLETEQHARDYGLDFYETIFEVLDYDELSEIAALGGDPTRDPHWRVGVGEPQPPEGDPDGGPKNHEDGINKRPCFAQLLRGQPNGDPKTPKDPPF